MSNNYELDMLARQAQERLAQQNQANNLNDVYTSEEDYYNEFFEEEDNNNQYGAKYYTETTVNQASNYDPNMDDVEYDIDNTGEELWKNGPTKSMIQLWKKQFEGHDICYVNIADYNFIIRTLNRHEYKSIVAIPNSNALNREEIICETVVLFPQEFSWKQMAVQKAGVPSALAEVIMKKSGFTNEYMIEVL